MSASAPASDILFQDADVCILDPKSERGMLVFTDSFRKGRDICGEGLFSYNELRKRHPELGLTERVMPHADHNDLIFFRAPYNNDVSTFKSSYDKTPEEMGPGITVIRIDPEKTFVYLSEARESPMTDDLAKTRTSMKDYFGTIIPLIKGDMLRYAFAKPKGINISESLIKDLIEHGNRLSRFFEVVVKLPHIPPEWFVYCKPTGGGFRRKRRGRHTRKTKKRKSTLRKFRK